MKYVFIEKHQAEFSIKAMCRVLRVARSGWYTWCQRRTRISTRQQFRQHCDSVVLAAFTRSKQRYGAPRLTDELRAQGYPFNVKTVAAREINGEHVPEIILLNSHDGTSSYQMLPGYFRFVCQNGCVCGQSLGEVRVPHRGNVVDRVIEGAYEVVGVFDRIEVMYSAWVWISRRHLLTPTM